MANAVQKIVLSASRDIPFNKLVLSQSNVRRLKAGISIEELAEDIARRTLLQSLSVRAVLDAEGQETGMFEIPAGGRRFRALELLVKQKRLAKNAPVPCVVREGGLAEEDSLAENVQRVALHPLDQFRAFQALREKGLGDDDIAARFFVTPTVVKQRLRLAAVSSTLLDVYAEDGMTLEQLMAFTVTNDHARQEQVWEAISRTYNKEAYYIRRQLTEGAVKALDRRARFIGVEAYEAAGGVVLRDLFQTDDDGGWLQDPALLDKLVIEKLQAEAEALRPEGWKWIAIAADFPYGHTAGLRRVTGEAIDFTEQETASLEALRAEYEALEAQYADADELPDEADQRLGEIEAAIAALEERPLNYDPAEIARAGAFVSLNDEGALQIVRGFVRSEDEAPVAPVAPLASIEELCAKLGDGVNQAADLVSDAASIPSRNFTPLMIFGNWFWPFSRRQFFEAAVTSLKTISRAVVLRQRAFHAHGAMPHGRKHALDRVRRAQMRPVLGGKVEKRQQRVAILQQAFDGVVVFRRVFLGESRHRRFGRRAAGRQPDFAQVLVRRRLKRFRQLVEHVGCFVQPASLMPRRRKRFLQRLPEAKRAVAHREFRRVRKAARLQIDQQFLPTLRALAKAGLEADQLLLAFGRGADQDQHAFGLRLHARLKIDAIGPEIDIAAR